ncbi:hypothetical protein L4D76_03465 [Photobacterium sagamiensis]|uniref:hypothetical protein n=1 Tax=Photobacterium sagamiensis TaxID=2910241 RepID=UPI003D0C734E
MSSDNFTVKDVVENLEIIRVRYELPDSSAFVRYEASFDDSQPEDRIRLKAQDGSPHMSLKERIGPGS